VAAADAAAAATVVAEAAAAAAAAAAVLNAAEADKAKLATKTVAIVVALTVVLSIIFGVLILRETPTGEDFLDKPLKGHQTKNEAFGKGVAA
jgi:hypothetical protein